MTRLDRLFRRLGELHTMADEIALETAQCKAEIATERAILVARNSKEVSGVLEVAKEELEANR